MLSSFLKNKFFLYLCVCFFSINACFAQDDLLNMLDTIPKKSERVLATFKTTRIVNGHTVETVKSHSLDFRVTHHFGSVGGPGGAGAHTMYGFDDASDIRIAFEYGVNERLTVGVGRSKIGELVDGYLKYRLLYQTQDNKVPVSVTLFANTAMTEVKSVNGPLDNNANRLSYFSQVLIARKFNSRISWQIMPGFLHRNYVDDADDENDIFVLGTGGRIKLTKRFALLADFYWVFSKYRMDRSDLFFPPLGLGVEIETGGHVFHLIFTNNPAIVENTFLVNSTDSWSKSQMKFGFNISRTFGIGKKGRQ